MPLPFPLLGALHPSYLEYWIAVNLLEMLTFQLSVLGSHLSRLLNSSPLKLPDNRFPETPNPLLGNHASSQCAFLILVCRSWPDNRTVVSSKSNVHDAIKLSMCHMTVICSPLPMLGTSLRDTYKMYPYRESHGTRALSSQECHLYI